MRASVIYVRILKSDLLKKQRLEEICNSQHDRLSLMINKIRVGKTGMTLIDKVIICHHSFRPVLMYNIRTYVYPRPRKCDKYRIKY